MFWQTFKQNYLIKFWNPVPAVIATGILSAYYFGLTGTYWAVTGEFTKWEGIFYNGSALISATGDISS